MIIVSNVTDKVSSPVFSKFAEEKAFMLECKISDKTNWYFGSDYMAINKKKRNFEKGMSYTKSLQVLHRKGISMLTDLKVFSLTCKCVFYRPELNVKGGLHRIESWKSWNEAYQWIEL